MRLARILVVFALLAAAPLADAGAIPAFARRYRVSCVLCHNPAPALNAFGETFAANGFRLSADEEPRDTISTGDDELWLFQDLPLAVRVDAYMRTYFDGPTSTDFQTPWNLKLLSGGAISRKLSYYVYFLLYERGEVGGLEDAYIELNDTFGVPLDLFAGQFQASDPMFKRELRLPYQDYAVYRARVGSQPADLTYDRGFMAMADVAGFAVTGEVLNGNGIGPATDRQLDDNRLKNFLGHVRRDVVPGLTLGLLGYRGQQEGVATGGPATLTNTLWMVGGDATVEVGAFQVIGQYVHREDDKPTFTLGEPTAVTDGGFAEVMFRPAGSRWYGVALYNRVVCSEPLLDVRLGGPADPRRYEALTAGGGYLVRRNFRVYGEVTGDLVMDNAVVTLGLTTAF